MRNVFTDTYIFEAVPWYDQRGGWRAWWDNVQVVKHVPQTFVRSVLLASDIIMALLAIEIVSTLQHNSLLVLLATEGLFLSVMGLLILSRASKRVSTMLAMYLGAMLLSLLLNFLFSGRWGNAGFYILCSIALYRLPSPLSLVLAGVDTFGLILTNTPMSLFPPYNNLNATMTLVILLLALTLVAWMGWARRTQYLLVVRLQDAHAQLQAEMAHAEELAASQERTRIARDIHDVLAHSLAILSIQVQAARSLVKRDPEKLTSSLDEMAALLKESMAESRRVVGLLREEPATLQHDQVGARLQIIANTFHELTKIHCLFHEEGTAQTLDAQQAQMLQYVLREALTNAHRHSAAQHISITLLWQGQQVSLHIWNDGKKRPTPGSQSGHTEETSGEGGHHGLQGMRERAVALGGTLEAEMQRQGNFAVTVCIPLSTEKQRLKTG